MGNRRDYLINEIVRVCKKLDEKGFVANHDGNVSVRFEEGFLATPTAESKAVINADMIIELDKSGKKIAGIGNPFSEIKLHLVCYKARPDAKAVVHAHPPYTTARGLIGKPLRPNLPEAVISIGDVIPVAAYSMPGAAEGESSLEEALKINDTVMMAGNGIISIGDTIEQAWLRIELVEHLLKIENYAMQMGQTMEIPPADRKSLLEKRKSIGLGPEARGVTQSMTSSKPNQKPQSVINNSYIKNIIADEIKKALKDF